MSDMQQAFIIGLVLAVIVVLLIAAARANRP